MRHRDVSAAMDFVGTVESGRSRGKYSVRSRLNDFLLRGDLHFWVLCVIVLNVQANAENVADILYGVNAGEARTLATAGRLRSFGGDMGLDRPIYGNFIYDVHYDLGAIELAQPHPPAN